MTTHHSQARRGARQRDLWGARYGLLTILAPAPVFLGMHLAGCFTPTSFRAVAVCAAVMVSICLGLLPGDGVDYEAP